jgi:hypothetical protein
MLPYAQPAQFRALGGDKERWRHEDHSAMCHALTAAGDVLEIGDSRKALFLAARQELRRALETTLA